MKVWLAIAMILVGTPAFATGPTMSYTYDSQGRLASGTYTNGAITATTTYNYDAAGNRTSVVITGNATQVSLTATQCTLVNGICTSTIQWSSAYVPYLYICEFDSRTPSTVKLFASGSSGTQQANWIQNAVYTFEINAPTQSAAGQECNTSTWLATTTTRPTNYTP